MRHFWRENSIFFYHLKENHLVMIEYEMPRSETKILNWTFQKKPTLLSIGLYAFTKSKIIQTAECNSFLLQKKSTKHMQQRKGLAIAANNLGTTGLCPKMQ